MNKFAQAVVNTNSSISAKNQIALTLALLGNENVNHAHLSFLKAYHDSLFDNNFHQPNQKDPIAKKNGCMNWHMMAVRYFVMNEQNNKFKLFYFSFIIAMYFSPIQRFKKWLTKSCCVNFCILFM